MSHLKTIAPKTIIDLGCGGGRNIGEQLKKYPDAKGTAIDYSELSVEKATEYNKEFITAGRLVIKQGNVSALELPDSKYDLATAFETIYFWPGLEKCFTEVARMLKDGGYFILDEATAFADPDNETKVQAAFEVLAKGKTLIMIAHRLSTVKNADCIYVLENGSVSESGSHAELMAKGGTYAQMYDEYTRSAEWRVKA